MLYGELLSSEITIIINGEKIVYSKEHLYEADFLKTYVKTFTLGNEISIKLETMEENQDEVQNAERIRYGTLESKRTRL